MQLESQNVSLIDLITLIKSAQNKLENVIGEVGVTIHNKLTNVLQKNVVFSTLQNISNILTGEITSMEGLPEDLNGDDLVYFKYACITSKDVERNFSRFKNILSNNRRRLDVDNLKKSFSV